MKPAAGAWIRFNAVGLGGIAIQLLVLELLVRWGLAAVPATVLAVEITVIHNFFWHEHWTWRHRNLDPHGIAGRFLYFNAGNGLISLAGNVTLMWFFTAELHIYYLVANLAAIATCASVNFVLSDRIFRLSRDRDDA